MFNTYIRWQMHLHSDISYDEFIKHLRDIKQLSNSNKIRSFQYRLLNFALELSTQLKMWKIKDTDNCTFCNMHSETLEHLFFSCPKIQPILKSAVDLVETYHNTQYNVIFTIENIIFKTIHSKKNHLLNCVMLIAQSYIYRNRCLQKKLSVPEFTDIVQKTCQYEKYYAIQSNKEKNSLLKMV